MEARNHMESFVDGELKSKSEMKEARAFLENAMEGIKKAEEEFAEKKFKRLLIEIDFNCTNLRHITLIPTQCYT